MLDTSNLLGTAMFYFCFTCEVRDMRENVSDNLAPIGIAVKVVILYNQCFSWLYNVHLISVVTDSEQWMVGQVDHFNTITIGTVE